MIGYRISRAKLEQLIEALGGGPPPCSGDAVAHADYCPCSRERLAALAAEAAQEIEARRQNAERAPAGCA